jgi:hypothetical protein
VRASFARLTLMQTIEARLLRVIPGAVEIQLPFRNDLAQQHGFRAAGLVTALVDTACSYAAMRLMPAGVGVLTVEYKVNFPSPARGHQMIARGHRGTFATTFDTGMVGTLALVPQVVDAVTVPVIASGGIMDGRGIVAALALGAAAVQMGTAFLTCNEAGIPNAYKEAILRAREHETRLTRAFSGRPARGIVNRFMTEVEHADTAEAILPFPLQNALTQPLRTTAAQQGRAEFLSLWTGQGVRLARRQAAATLIAQLAHETEAVIQRLAGEHPKAR